MTAPLDLDAIIKLVSDVSDLNFKCGEWTSVDEGAYGVLYNESEAAEQKLVHEIESLNADRHRLEWLVEHHASFGMMTRIDAIEEDGEIIRYKESSARFARVPCQNLFEWHVYDGATWRDALDAAMAAPPCKGELGECSQSHSIRPDVADATPPLRVLTLEAECERLQARVTELEDAINGKLDLVDVVHSVRESL